MNLRNKNLFLAFLITFLLTLFQPALFPFLRLMFFVPFLIILFYQKSYLTCLWISFGCGLILDLLSSKTHFGLFALNYTLTTWILYERRRNFFGDNLSTLPIMTFFFSVITTVIQYGLMYMFENNFHLSFKWIVSDLLVMPLADSTYAFILFILPSFILGKTPRRGSDYFAN